MNVRGVGEKSFLTLKPPVTVTARKASRRASSGVRVGRGRSPGVAAARRQIAKDHGPSSDRGRNDRPLLTSAGRASSTSLSIRIMRISTRVPLEDEPPPRNEQCWHDKRLCTFCISS